MPNLALTWPSDTMLRGTSEDDLLSQLKGKLIMNNNNNDNDTDKVQSEVSYDIQPQQTGLTD